ncbi:hypothetical protein C8Q77DRAFT_238152 [Trametes polyzona]|nr:hypothetical protein C8Q77DRAFT_238152 [Trametes polyzona]
MRLIDLTLYPRLKFVEVTNPEEHRYAILSHVWDKQMNESGIAVSIEAVYKDLVGLAKAPDSAFILPRDLKFRKLRRFCRRASNEGYKLVWADMCCIDKSSSEESAEAITSMFHWYFCAEVCYAYLRDVPFPASGSPTMPWTDVFKSSIWFKRGWTLQELIASRSLVFLSQDDWKVIGSKRGHLASLTSAATGIPIDILTHKRKPDEESVACRMAWASNRVTERVEDRAYSLMGLFGVRIPVVYGEGGYAFIRLQEEILRRVSDPSILAWGPRMPLSKLGLTPTAPEERTAGGDHETIHVRARKGYSPQQDWDPGYLLAPSLESFSQPRHSESSSLQLYGPISMSRQRTTLRGGGSPTMMRIETFGMLVMKAFALPYRGPSDQPYYLILLGCENDDGSEAIALLLSPGSQPADPKQTPHSSTTHTSWNIGARMEPLPNELEGFYCRLVTLTAREYESVVGRAPPSGFDSAYNRLVTLPLSAPMSHWDAGDPRMTSATVELLSQYRGSFRVHLAGWCKSALEECPDIIFDTNEERRPSKAHPGNPYIFLPASDDHVFYIRHAHGGREVKARAIELVFTSCPQHAQTPDSCTGPRAGGLFALVGRVLPLESAPLQCQSCSGDIGDHLREWTHWNLHGTVASRTLHIIARPAITSDTASEETRRYKLSISLQATLVQRNARPDVGKEHADYLLELELSPEDLVSAL